MIVPNSGPHVARIERLEDELQIARDRIKELEEVLGIGDDLMPFRLLGLSDQQARVANLVFKRGVVTFEQCRQVVYAEDPERIYDVQRKTIDVVMCHTRKKLKKFGIKIITEGAGFGFVGVRMDGPSKWRLGQLIASKSRLIGYEREIVTRKSYAPDGKFMKSSQGERRISNGL